MGGREIEEENTERAIGDFAMPASMTGRSPWGRLEKDIAQFALRFIPKLDCPIELDSSWIDVRKTPGKRALKIQAAARKAETSKRRRVREMVVGL